GCGLGVTVPISIKPNPKLVISAIYSAFLSKPAAKPTGFLNLRPKTSRSKRGSSTVYIAFNNCLAPQILEKTFNPPVTLWCASSGFIVKNIGLTNLYIMAKLIKQEEIF